MQYNITNADYYYFCLNTAKTLGNNTFFIKFANMNFNFLFWNLCKKNIASNISKLSDYYNIDLLLLCECRIKNSDLLLGINNSRSSNLFHFIGENDRGIKAFSTYSNSELEEISTHIPELLVLRIKKVNVLIFVVHLPSKMHFTKDAIFTSSQIVKEINRFENLYATSKSLVIGDFNVNPFERAMVEYNCFNSVMSMDIASQRFRQISNEKYEYFYNPMWSFFGDLSNFSPGTYLYKTHSYDNHYKWNMLDQIIMKPDLIPFFDQNSIRIVNDDGINPLRLSKSSKNHSDHYPIFCNFAF
jgi:hypothetical protein